jgi:transposase
MGRRGYPSDLSDEQWGLVECLLPQWPRRSWRGGRERSTDLREVVNAILYVVKTGIPWRYLPADFPPAKTVYKYFSTWSDFGVITAIHDVLRQRTRIAAGRAPAPTAAILDSQTVKNDAGVPADTTGYDAGKKIKGRKRHIVVDTLGLLLVVLVSAASLQDSPAAHQVLPALKSAYPSVTTIWADGGYNAQVAARAASEHRINVQIVPRLPGQKGFTVLPRRWVVERTFAWLTQHRRLVRDYEKTITASQSMTYLAMTRTMLNQLTKKHH